MPQYPLNLNTENPSGSFVAQKTDAAGVLMSSAGGLLSALNITVPTAIKAAPGRISRISVLGAVGTGGTITINDCATLGAATTANQIFSTAGTVAVGTVLTLDLPCAVGIVVSALPTGGTPHLAISYS